MKLAKKNVLVINVYIGRDNVNNCYAKIKDSFVIIPDKNKRKLLQDESRCDLISWSMNGVRQHASEYILEHFGMNIRHMSDHKNIVINEIDVIKHKNL